MVSRVSTPSTEPVSTVRAPPALSLVGEAGATRREAVLDVIGEPDPVGSGLTVALRRETKRYWDRHVEPLIDRHWPEVRSLPFYAKFKIGAQQVYAPAPYTVVVVSKNRPPVLRLFNRVCRGLRLPRAFLVAGLKAMLPVFAWLLLRKENRRIALMAAFIALVDEAFDHHLDGVPPDERGRLLREVLSGAREAPNSAFALVRAIRVALEEGCDDE